MGGAAVHKLSALQIHGHSSLTNFIMQSNKNVATKRNKQCQTIICIIKYQKPLQLSQSFVYSSGGAWTVPPPPTCDKLGRPDTAIQPV